MTKCYGVTECDTLVLEEVTLRGSDTYLLYAPLDVLLLLLHVLVLSSIIYWCLYLRLKEFLLLNDKLFILCVNVGSL